jgi:hypothetical protein
MPWTGARPASVDLVPVVLLTIVAAVLRVSQLHQSLLGDEVFTYQDIVGRSFAQVVTTVHTGGENSPPLFFVLAWASAHLADPSTWIRLPSFVLSSATVPLLYLLGRAVHGRLAGLIAAGCYAVAPFAVFYGIEARPYATMMFFVTLSTLAVLRAVRSGSRGWWLAYTLTAAAAAYSHYTAIFALAVQALWSLSVCRDRLGKAVFFNAAIVVLYLPWLPHLRGKALAVIGYLYPLGARRVLTDLLRPFPGHPAAPLRAIPTLVGLLVVAACLAAGAAALIARRRREAGPGGRRLAGSPGQVLMALMVFATPVGLLLYSLLDTDLWLPRGLSASLPAIVVAVGGLVAALPRKALVVALAALAVVLVAGTLRSYDAAYARGPFRAVATYLDRNAPPQDPVMIVSIVGTPAVQAQLHKPHKLESALASTWSAVPPGGTAYIGLDEQLMAIHKLFIPHHRGFAITSVKQFRAGYSLELLTYRRTAGS